jgi:hypothetical protein
LGEKIWIFFQPANGGFRRILVVAARFAQGPLTKLTAGARAWQRLRASKAPEGKLDAGEGDDGGQRFGEVSKSLARRLLRPNQEKVRSTTQRRGVRSLPAGAFAGWGLHPLEKRRLVTAHVDSRPLQPSQIVRSRLSNSMLESGGTTPEDYPE